MTPAVREHALLLGTRNPMVGVLTPGFLQSDDNVHPWVVFLNAGIIHRVGPNRIHVLLARQLAAIGYSSLRVDLHGIGDSDKRADALPPLDASLADVREVLDWLEANRNAKQVILMGLCSGADHSVLYAGSDPRVAGIVLLDPSIPHTPGYYLRYYGSRLIRIRSWRSFGSDLRLQVTNLARLVKHGYATNSKPAAPSIDSPEVKAYLKNAYQKAMDQEVEVLAVFTGNRESRHNYREQMFDAFEGVEFGSKLQLEFLSESDHTFTSEVQRQSLIELIVRWTRTRDFRRATQVA